MKNAACLLALLFCAPAWGAKPAPRPGKTLPNAAPRAARAGTVVSTRTVAPAESAEAAGGGTGEALNVTITGEAKDQIPVVIDPPPVEIDFHDVVGLSRDGQTERVVNGPMKIIPGGELLSMALLEPRQTVGSLPVRIPAPPFIQMEVATGVEAARWDFRVLDQENHVVYRQDGASDLRDLLTWNGFENDKLRLLTGEVYTPLLIITTKTGKIERYYGEPVLLDVLQYDLDNEHRVEFANDGLFGPGSSDIPADMAPVLKGLLGMMRRRAGPGYRVSVAFAPNEEPLAKARVATLKSLLEETLLWEPTAITFSVAPAGARGDATEVRFPVGRP